jgi:hypothetical protein
MACSYFAITPIGTFSYFFIRDITHTNSPSPTSNDKLAVVLRKGLSPQICSPVTVQQGFNRSVGFPESGDVTAFDIESAHVI